MFSANVEEERKLARALLPENREAPLNGRKKITEIVYELGGESQPVSWQDIQKRYQEKYDRELAGKVWTAGIFFKFIFNYFLLPPKLFRLTITGAQGHVPTGQGSGHHPTAIYDGS